MDNGWININELNGLVYEFQFVDNNAAKFLSFLALFSLFKPFREKWIRLSYNTYE